MGMKLPKHATSVIDGLLYRFLKDEIHSASDILEDLVLVANRSYKKPFEEEREAIQHEMFRRASPTEWWHDDDGRKVFYYGTLSSESIVGMPHIASIQRFTSRLAKATIAFNATEFVSKVAWHLEDEIQNRLKLVPLKGPFKNLPLQTFSEALKEVHIWAKKQGKIDASMQALELFLEEQNNGWTLLKDLPHQAEKHQLAMDVFQTWLEKRIAKNREP